MASDSVSFDRSASGIPYTLREGYPTFSFSDESNTAKEQYIIHKFNMSAFHLISMPPPIVFGDNVIVPPRRPLPGTLALVTKSLDFSPLKQDLPQDPFNLFGEYGYDNDYMVVDISYETNAINEEEDDTQDPITFLEVGFDTTAELLKVPVMRTHFGEEETVAGQETNAEDINVDNDIPATIVIPTTTYTLNWKLALNPNFKLFRSLIGRLNKLKDPLFFDAPKETILFAGFSGKRSFLWQDDGSTTVTPWDLNFKFVGKHVEADNVVDAAVAGWNHVYRPSTGKWERIVRANGSFLYDTTSTWEQMFRSGGLGP